jgi:hypothetical protein
MVKIIKTKLYSLFLFGEGEKDRKFLQKLADSEKFSFHADKWFPKFSNSHGVSPACVLDDCVKQSMGESYDLIICFIDLDWMIKKFPKDWEKQKKLLEDKYENLHNIKIIWQVEKAEDEYRRALGKNDISDTRAVYEALRNINSFINKEFYNRIMELIKNKERDLDSKKIL